MEKYYNNQSENITCMLYFQCRKYCFLLSFQFCPSNISVCLSVFSADFNIDSPSLNPTCKNYQHHVGLCHPRTCKNYQKSSVCYLENQNGFDLDGDFFIPVLSAVIAVVLHWADMMPSHSMDLPVPRGTSMLMLGEKFTSYGTKTAMQM